MKIDYCIEEEARSYNYPLVLESGDAFAVNSEVKGFSYSISEVKPATTPKGLVMRDGSLVILAEKE